MTRIWVCLACLPVALSFLSSSAPIKSVQSTSGTLGTGSAPARPRPKDLPPSRTHSEVRIDESVTYRPTPPNRGRVAAPQKGRPLQAGIVSSFSLNPVTGSKWFNLGRDGQVGVFGIVSTGAAQIRLQFSRAALPRGARLFVYSMKNRDEIYGPYLDREPSKDGKFWTPPVEGDGIIVEYFTPGHSLRSKSGNVPFLVSAISHIF